VENIFFDFYSVELYALEIIFQNCVVFVLSLSYVVLHVCVPKEFSWFSLFSLHRTWRCESFAVS